MSTVRSRLCRRRILWLKTQSEALDEINRWIAIRQIWECEFQHKTSNAVENVDYTSIDFLWQSLESKVITNNDNRNIDSDTANRRFAAYSVKVMAISPILHILLCHTEGWNLAIPQSLCIGYSAGLVGFIVSTAVITIFGEIVHATCLIAQCCIARIESQMHAKNHKLPLLGGCFACPIAFFTPVVLSHSWLYSQGVLRM